MTILFIEDDTIECMKMQRTLSKLESKHQVIEVRNGKEALSYLKSDRALPDIILLDLNMPLLNGIEFLELLKGDAKLRYLPAVVLTTSQNRADLHECYRLGIAGYLIKPLKLQDYEEMVSRFIRYWEINELVKG